MEQIYQEQVWNRYAETHLSVLPSLQTAVYRYVASIAEGNIIDFGCGTARFAAFLNGNKKVESYIGVDYSLDMVERARWLVGQFEQPHWNIVHDRIENITKTQFTFGVSINSYYSWDDPLATLSTIYQLLENSSTFILITPNPSLSMKKLEKEADKELIGHPHYSAFKEHNFSLAGNEKALFVPMHELVKQVIEVGFKVEACHQEFYLGGLNFLRLEK